MDHQTNVATAERRTRQEIRQIVAEFATSGMQQSEFCRSRGISRSTLDRYLRKQRAQDQSRGHNRLLAVEIRTARGSSASNSSGLVVALVSGSRIEVNRGFDEATLERLLTVLDKG